MYDVRLQADLTCLLYQLSFGGHSPMANLKRSANPPTTISSPLLRGVRGVFANQSQQV